MTEETPDKQKLKWQHNCPLLPLMAHFKKYKKCCKSYKDGDRCKKCPGRK